MGESKMEKTQAEGAVLCGASAYDQKYYFNPAFDRLPQGVKDELRILCTLFTEEVGGILTLAFTPSGRLRLETASEEGDLLYDDVSCGLLIREVRRKKRELFEGLEMYYKIQFLGMDASSILEGDAEDEEEEEDAL